MKTLTLAVIVLMLGACDSLKPAPVELSAENTVPTLTLGDAEPDIQFDDLAWLPVPETPQERGDCLREASARLCSFLTTLPDRILFVPSSPELTAESKPHLDSLIQYLRAENIQLSVLTHVNSTDDPLLDIWLAKRRTLTVIRYLAAQGIEQGRLRPLEPPLSSAAQEVNPDQESGQVELNVVIRQRG